MVPRSFQAYQDGQLLVADDCGGDMVSVKDECSAPRARDLGVFRIALAN